MSTIHEALQTMAGPLEAQDGGWSQVYTLQPDFPGFDGHFPGQPIVPGVVQVQMAMRVIAQARGKTPVLREIIQTKFKAPVGPLQAVRVSVKPALVPDTPDAAYVAAEKWICTLTCGAVDVAHCRLLLEFPL